MAPFLRIAFNSYDLGVLPPLADAPFCAIKMKEALTTGEKHFVCTIVWFMGVVTWVKRLFLLLFCAEKQKSLFFSSFYCPFSSLLERGKTLVQRKPTMYPAWKACFDAHIYEGRVLEVLLMKTAEEPLAEVTVGVSVLAERCKKANGRAEFWVGLDRVSSVPCRAKIWAVCV